MADYKQRYKNPRQGFGDADHRRIVNAYKKDQTRREIRTKTFDKNRKIRDVSVSPEPDVPVADKRMKKLIKWKEERNKKKKLEDSKRKPVFKVGVVHHSYYSPVAKSSTSISAATVKGAKEVKPFNHTQKRITRATEKRLLAKAAATTAKQVPASPKFCSKWFAKRLENNKTLISKDEEQKSSPSLLHKLLANRKFKLPEPTSVLPLFGLIPMHQTPEKERKIFVLHKSKEPNTLDTNDKGDEVSQELSTQIPNSNITEKCITTKSKNSTSLKLSPKKRASRRRTSNKRLTDNSDNVTAESNASITRLSLSEQIKQNFSHEEEFSLNNMKTSLQKTPLVSEPSEKENSNDDLITFSPYLTISRGKSNARKEQQIRLGIGGSPSDEIPTKDTVMKSLNISVEEEERTAQYFKLLLRKETDRLKELCEKWMDIRLEKDIPEDTMYEINQAVGQTNLLINKKFERFRGLVLDCETGKGERLVTCRDLQGFWDMTYMEVRNCDSRFEKLEERRKRNWQEEVAVHTGVPITKKRMPIKRQSAKPSSLRSLILAARQKKMKELNAEDSLPQNKDINKGRVISPSRCRKSIVFKENTDIVHNKGQSKSVDNKITSSRRNSSRVSSVRKVHLSDASKKMKSPFTIMKISQMCKALDPQLHDTISYINCDQTPGKSILKKSEEIVNKDVRIKSAHQHKVNFDDQIVLTDVPVDEETKTKLSLTAALNRIDNLDLDDFSLTECIDAKKELMFENEDSNTSNNSDNSEWIYDVQREFKKKKNKSQSSLPSSSNSNTNLRDALPVASFKESSPNDNLKSHRKSLKGRVQIEKMIDDSTTKIPTTNISCATLSPTDTSTSSETISNVTHMEQEYDAGIRVLRSRIINNTPKMKQMTPKKILTLKENINKKKENKSPDSSLKLLQNDENKHMQPNENNVIRNNEGIDKKRRSTRKSVVFNVDNACLACTENKSVLPMTPHSKRRSKTPSKRSRGKYVLDKDLISWETPERLPSRVTRSHTKN